MRPLWTLATIIWLMAILTLSALKSLGFAAQELHTLERVLGGDLSVHVIFAGVLGFLSLMALPAPVTSFFRQPVFLLILLGCLFEELIQYYIPARAFSWYDFLASAAGLSFGALIASLYNRQGVCRT